MVLENKLLKCTFSCDELYIVDHYYFGVGDISSDAIVSFHFYFHVSSL